MNEQATADPNKIRRFRRREINVRVAVISNGKVRFAESLEISEGGMLFRSGEKYPTGAKVEICMFIPGDKFISSGAEVTYVLDEAEEARVGIKFKDPENDLKIAIRQFVDHSG